MDLACCNKMFICIYYMPALRYNYVIVCYIYALVHVLSSSVLLFILFFYAEQWVGQL